MPDEDTFDAESPIGDSPEINEDNMQEAAIAEVENMPRSVEWEGMTFLVRPKMPFRLLKYFGASVTPGPVEMLGITNALFVQDTFEQFWDKYGDLDMEAGAIKFGELLQLAFESYGLTTPESAASPVS